MRKNSCERKISISLICMQSVFPSTVCMWGKLPVIAVLSYSKGLSYAERTEGLGDAQGMLSSSVFQTIELCNFEYSGNEPKKFKIFVYLPSL